MGDGQIGETGVHVSVITAPEQEPGTELDLVVILLLLVLAGDQNSDVSLPQYTRKTSNIFY